MIAGGLYFSIRVRDIVWRAKRQDLEAAIACAPLTEYMKMRLLLFVVLSITPIFLLELVWLIIGSTWVWSIGSQATCPHELYSFTHRFINGTWYVPLTGRLLAFFHLTTNSLTRSCGHVLLPGW